jgi:hypothetical protein
MAHRSEGKGIASDRPIDRDDWRWILGLAQFEPRAFVSSDAEELDNPAHAVAPEPSRRAASDSSDRAESHGRSIDDLEDDHSRNTSERVNILGELNTPSKLGNVEEAQRLLEECPYYRVSRELAFSGRTCSSTGGSEVFIDFGQSQWRPNTHTHKLSKFSCKQYWLSNIIHCISTVKKVQKSLFILERMYSALFQIY